MTFHLRTYLLGPQMSGWPLSVLYKMTFYRGIGGHNLLLISYFKILYFVIICIWHSKSLWCEEVTFTPSTIRAHHHWHCSLRHTQEPQKSYKYLVLYTFLQYPKGFNLNHTIKSYKRSLWFDTSPRMESDVKLDTLYPTSS